MGLISCFLSGKKNDAVGEPKYQHFNIWIHIWLHFPTCTRVFSLHTAPGIVATEKEIGNKIRMKGRLSEMCGFEWTLLVHNQTSGDWLGTVVRNLQRGMSLREWSLWSMEWSEAQKRKVAFAKYFNVAGLAERKNLPLTIYTMKIISQRLDAKWKRDVPFRRRTALGGLFALLWFQPVIGSRT